MWQGFSNNLLNKSFQRLFGSKKQDRAEYTAGNDLSKRHRCGIKRYYIKALRAWRCVTKIAYKCNNYSIRDDVRYRTKPTRHLFISYLADKICANRACQRSNGAKQNIKRRAARKYIRKQATDVKPRDSRRRYKGKRYKHFRKSHLYRVFVKSQSH